MQRWHLIGWSFIRSLHPFPDPRPFVSPTNRWSLGYRHRGSPSQQRHRFLFTNSVLEIMPPISKWLQTTSISYQSSGLVDNRIICGYCLDFLSYTRAQEWKCLNIWEPAKSKEKSSGWERKGRMKDVVWLVAVILVCQLPPLPRHLDQDSNCYHHHQHHYHHHHQNHQHHYHHHHHHHHHDYQHNHHHHQHHYYHHYQHYQHHILLWLWGLKRDWNGEEGCQR